MNFFKKPEHELWVMTGCSLALLLASGMWAYIALHGINEPLILHFSPYTGINQIGGLGDLLGVACTALVLIGVNTGAAFVLLKREPLLARLMGFTTLFMALLLFLGFLAIIGANT